MSEAHEAEIVSKLKRAQDELRIIIEDVRTVETPQQRSCKFRHAG